jgi:dipeptidase E
MSDHTVAMDLLLGSQGLGALGAWLDTLSRRPRRAVLVPTAGNPLPETPWVEVAEAAMSAEGLRVRRLDLEPSTPEDVSAVLAEADLVFVTGGYPIFLLQHAQRTGFLVAVRQGATSGQFAYAGMSSGAALAAPDLARYRGEDDPGQMSDTAGLGLVSFYPLSHANRGRAELYAQIIAEQGNRYDFVPVRDDQAIVVHDGERQIKPS